MLEASKNKEFDSEVLEMKHVYYIEKDDASIDFLCISQNPMNFTDAMHFAMKNKVNNVFSLRALETKIDASKLKREQLEKLDGEHNLLDEVSFLKIEQTDEKYIVFKNEYSALWIIPDMIKKLYQKNVIRNVFIRNDGVTIVAEHKSGIIGCFDFTKDKQWYNSNFERHICKDFEQYREIHMWVMTLVTKCMEDKHE